MVLESMNLYPPKNAYPISYQFISTVAITDDNDPSPPSSSKSDSKQDEAFGLGGAKLNAVLSDMKKST
ncbi:hypothetical protein BDR04DRAFT_1093106 [Suillus decipiens]|nr:hypothetical protein BDR04DRAFT_1093106 [Suillus decipiens]